jgi:hypothetical protein
MVLRGLVAVVLAWCVGALPLDAARRADEGRRAQKASTLLAALSRGDAERATADFSPDLKARLPAARLKAAWDALVKQFGAFKSFGTPEPAKDAGATVLRVKCVFEKNPVDARVAFNDKDEVAGLFFGAAQ